MIENTLKKIGWKIIQIFQPIFLNFFALSSTREIAKGSI